MKVKKFIIAGGNTTLLVWDCSPAQKRKVLKQYLGEVEQIAFISNQDGLPKLTMMGNEMCINATLALAYELGNNGKLFSSEFEGEISYVNSNEITQIQFGLTFERLDDIILLPGIGFVFSKNKRKQSKEFLSILTSMFKRPAFGTIVIKRNKIAPLIYVRETNSLCRETACGSASIALNILRNVTNVVQPTGDIISVTKRKNLFCVSTKVKEVEFYNQE